MVGGAVVAGGAVRTLSPRLGCVYLRSANCGIISVGTTGRGKVYIYGVPTCSAGTITRRIFTFVLRFTGRASLRSSSIRTNS